MYAFLWLTALLLFIGVISPRRTHIHPYIYKDCIVDTERQRAARYTHLIANERDSYQFLQREARGIELKKQWMTTPKVHCSAS